VSMYLRVHTTWRDCSGDDGRTWGGKGTTRPGFDEDLRIEGPGVRVTRGCFDLLAAARSAITRRRRCSMRAVIAAAVRGVTLAGRDVGMRGKTGEVLSALLMGMGSLDRVEFERTRLAELSLICNFENKDAKEDERAGTGIPELLTNVCERDDE